MRTATFKAAVSVMLFGTIALAQSVTYDFDRSAHFSQFKTYAWVRGTEIADELNHARVVRSVEAQLAAKGLSRVGAGANPDVFVAYHASFGKNIRISAYDTGWGAPRFGGLRSGTASTQEVVTGSLVVDIIDARSNHIVWRGIASSELDLAAKPDKRDKNVNKAAEKLFKNYPPKP